jgi:hypothetical protein
MRPNDCGIITVKQACRFLNIKPWPLYHLLDTAVIGSYWTDDHRGWWTSTTSSSTRLLRLRLTAPPGCLRF